MAFYFYTIIRTLSEFISDSLEIENKLNKIDRNINNIVSAIDKVKN